MDASWWTILLNILLIGLKFLWDWWSDRKKRKEQEAKIEKAAHEAAERALRIALQSNRNDNEDTIDLEDRVDQFRREMMLAKAKKDQDKDQKANE